MSPTPVNSSGWEELGLPTLLITPLLRRVVFVGEAALGASFDLERVGLVRDRVIALEHLAAAAIGLVPEG
jgi:hypothetical protein